MGVSSTHTILRELVSVTDRSMFCADANVGGGHAPEIIVVCGLDNELPSSTNSMRPFTKDTLDEHLDVRCSF